jgi:hypothetical protein
MSENTNSMFWIICGAVIVLGIFLLLNGSMDSTITGIFNHFKSIFTIGG